MKYGKSLSTNVLAASVLVAGYYSPWYGPQVFSVGLFALSGAFTNWLAVYMLFEKIPGLYGSGIIPNRFEEFKIGIKSLIMDQFFTRENLSRFLSGGTGPKDISGHAAAISDAIDYSHIFGKLVEVIKGSSFGSMLGMFGGDAALEPLKKPFEEKMRETVGDIMSSDAVIKLLAPDSGTDITDVILEKVSGIVTARLNELTPVMVKDIIQNMIHEHLGWLVIWGGVFGGIIGLIASFFPVVG